MATDRTPEDRSKSIPDDQTVLLSVNVGSSSLKFALYRATDEPEKILSGKLDRIGHPGGSRTVTYPDGRVETSSVDGSDHSRVARELVDWLQKSQPGQTIAAVGHRVVHGGPNLVEPVLITPEVLEELERISPLDPDHLPLERKTIEVFQSILPESLHVACFDTAFHHDLPRVAQIVPIPRKFEPKGVRRYGFHGLSYAYLVEELGRIAGVEARGRVILAHLGSGASMTATFEGRSVDTSMGLTPASGLVMSTRAGDIDPGLARFLMQTEGLSSEQFDHLVNAESGLLGVSETSGDLRDLLEKRNDDDRAREAVDLFAYQAKKWIGAYTATLGGLDTLVFSGGIGENSPEVRSMICAGLEYLGLALDDARNRDNAPLISTDGSRVKVRVIKTDEEQMIARASARLLK